VSARPACLTNASIALHAVNLHRHHIALETHTPQYNARSANLQLEVRDAGQQAPAVGDLSAVVL